MCACTVLTAGCTPRWSSPWGNCKPSTGRRGCLSSSLHLSIPALSPCPSQLEGIWALTALCHIKTQRSKAARSGEEKEGDRQRDTRGIKNKGDDVRRRAKRKKMGSIEREREMGSTTEREELKGSEYNVKIFTRVKT